MKAPEDRPRAVKGTRHLVITVHGIRTFGGWQEKLEAALRSNRKGDDSFEVLNYRFGWFSVLRFLFPISRWFVTRRFRNWLLDRYRGRPGLERVDFVAHSFGSWLVAYALASLPKRPDLPQAGTVILAGSVLREDFRWNDLLDEQRVRRVANECALFDVPLIFSQLTGLGTGMAGRIGFHGGEGARFRNRFYDFGHSGWFYDEQRRPSDQRLRELWVPLLIGGLSEPIPERGRPPHQLPWWVEPWHIFLLNARPFKLVLYTVLVLLPIFGFLSYRQQKNHERELETQRADLADRLFKQAQLVEWAKLVERNPALVQHYLYGAEGARPSDQVAGVLASLRFTDPELQDPNRVWKRLDSLGRQLQSSNGDDDPFRRHIHGLILTWLTRNALPGETAADAVPLAERLRTVRGCFDRALADYTKPDKPAPPFLIALCRLDYGRCLIELDQPLEGQSQLAHAQNIVREHASPQSAAWFHVEAHTQQAVSKRYQKEPDRFAEAINDLRLALEAANESADPHYLLGATYNRLGWFHLDRFDLSPAEQSFREAEKVLFRVKDDDAQAGVDWFHARHGLAMVKRLQGDRVGARQDFRAIADAIGMALDRPAFSPRQRRALCTRQINAREREGDCMLIARSFADIHAAEAIGGYEQVEALSHRYEFDKNPQGLLTLAVNQCKLGAALALVGKPEMAERKLAEVARRLEQFRLKGDADRLRLFLTLSRGCVQALRSTAPVSMDELRRFRDEFMALLGQTQSARRFQRDEVEFLLLVEAVLLERSPDEAARRQIAAATNRLKDQVFPAQTAPPAPPPPLIQKR